MKRKLRICIWFTLIYLAFPPAWAQNNLSPLVRSLGPFSATKEAFEKSIQQHCGEFCVYSYGKRYLSGTISWKAKPDLQPLEKEGVKIRTLFPFGATVLIPEEKLGWLAAQTWLSFLDLDQPKNTAMREQRRDLNADKVQLGQDDLDRAYNGENVLIAIIDQGFDYTHPTFWDSTYQNSRILMVWDQMASGTPPDGYSYGKLIRNQDLKNEKGDRFYTATSHGSHVAGIAAGSGYPTPSQSFRGVAPKASIILISCDLSDSKVSDALAFASAYAKNQNMPLVVNMSFGGYGSAMDGTSFLDRAIDNKAGTGCLIAVAVGNEGELAQFASFTTTQSQPFWKYIVSGSKAKSFVQVWGPENTNATVRMGLIHQSTYEQWVSNAYSASSFTTFSVPAEHNWSFKYSTYSAYEINNKRLWNIELVPGDPNYLPFVEVISNKADEVFQVLSPYMNLLNKINGQEITGFSKGDTISNGRSPGMTSASAISVGAHVAKDTVYTFGKPTGSVLENGPALGELCSFSSRGPSFSGLIKPDVSAPGFLVSSSVSSADVNYQSSPKTESYTEYKATINGTLYRYYCDFYGTSMATPMVTGCLALLLQANPLLTPAQAKEVLSETARKDAFTRLTAGEKNNRFGFGKMDLYQAMLKTLNITPTVPEGKDLLLFPNPTSGDLSLVLPEATTFSEVQMINMLGQVVSKKSALSGSFLSLSVADVRQGQYMLQIQTNKGRILRRIVVNR